MTNITSLTLSELVKNIKNEYLERKGDEVYEAMIPEGPPPVNDN